MISWCRGKNEIRLGLMFIMICCSMLLLAANPAQATDTAVQEEVKTQFPDVNTNDANALYISFLVGRGIINGYEDGRYHPEEGLTRAQAATVIVKAANLPINPDTPSIFIDVSDDYWGKDYIAAAAKAGYISGYPDRSYRPEQKLTRAEAISLILRLSKQPLNAKLPALTDISSNHWAASEVAVGLASGMIGLSEDGKQFFPDAPFTRMELAHALGILLTQDPGFYTVPLEGQLKVREGRVSIQAGENGDVIKVMTESVVKAGDIIITKQQSSAVLNYPDGSSMLLKENTQISVVESQGRRYLKIDGSEGTAVDWLNIKLKQGIMLAGLASKYETSNGEQPGEHKTTGQLYQVDEQLIAGLNGWEFIADADKQQPPWYVASQQKKVKIKVDMPYGVAAVRGTFVAINVSTGGQSSVSCLTGDVDVSNGGITVSLTGNQSTQVTQQSTAPQAVTTMLPEAVGEFVEEQNWLEQTAQAMENNREMATPPLSAAASTPISPVEPPVIPESVLENIRQALQEISPAPTPTNAASDFESSNIKHVSDISLTKSTMELGIDSPVIEMSRGELCKFLVESFSLFDSSATSAFSDVPAENFYYSYVSSAYKAGLVTGYPDGTFKPDDLVTRAEYAVIVTRHLGYIDHVIRKVSRAELCKFVVDSFSLYDDSVTTTLTDVSSSVYAQHISSAIMAGLFSGYPDNTFKPDNPITRDEYAAFVARLVHFTDNNTFEAITRAELCGLIVESFFLNDDNVATYFTDVPENHVYYPYISSAVKAGLIGGYPDGTFKPDEITNINGYIVMLTRLLGFTNEQKQTEATDISDDWEWAKNSILKALNSGIMFLYADESFKPDQIMAMNPDGQLIASISPADATNKSILWTSSDESIASVDHSGQVTGKKAGSAVISATSIDGNKTASCTVTVNP